ncbi:MAG: CPBP family intramembrane metalloprotease [Alphaproteobacteria bacterium]|nr:CPBP family intramembrane metalloprotease [Alphaproteobacteria bacterium]
MLGTIAAALLGVVVIVIAMFLRVKIDTVSISGALGTNFWAIMATLGLNNLAMLGSLVWVVRRRLPNPIAHYFTPVPRRWLIYAALAGIAISMLINGGNELMQRAGWVNFTDTPLERAMLPHGAAPFIMSVLVVSVLAPLVEEFLFRGLLMRWLQQVGGISVAVAVSSLLFGLLHGQFFIHPGAQGILFTVQLTGAGVALAVTAYRTGSLRTSFVLHAAYNFTATILGVFLP